MEPDTDLRGDMWVEIWHGPASAIDIHAKAGRAHPLTEDVLRFALIAGLEAHGVAPAALRVEVIEPLVDGKLDLAIGEPIEAAFELKFPRGSRTGISPDTMTLGELVKDFYRLARLPAPHRFAVQLINHRLRRYLERRTDIAWTFVEGGRLVLPAGLASALPLTARRSLPTWAAELSVHACCRTALPRGDHTLAVYEIEQSSALP